LRQGRQKNRPEILADVEIIPPSASLDRRPVSALQWTREKTMRYMIVIFNDEQAWAKLSPAEMEAEMGAYFAYSSALGQSGKLVAGEELHPGATAKTIRVSAAGVTVKDGPYADIKEQFGGFYVIDVADEAEAIAWAQKCPGARHGAVEVRPCVDHGSM
jgi:hypothetical protein